MYTAQEVTASAGDAGRLGVTLKSPRIFLSEFAANNCNQSPWNRQSENKNNCLPMWSLLSRSSRVLSRAGSPHLASLSSMKAVVLPEPGPIENLVLQTVEQPEAGPGQVRSQVPQLPRRTVIMHVTPLSPQCTVHPSPPSPLAQVKVRVSACGVCHRDCLDRTGAFPFIKRPTVR
jgi:hypothetical protein